MKIVHMVRDKFELVRERIEIIYYYIDHTDIYFDANISHSGVPFFTVNSFFR